MENNQAEATTPPPAKVAEQSTEAKAKTAENNAPTPKPDQEEKPEPKPELKDIRNPFKLISVYLGEIRAAMLIAIPVQIAQFVLYNIVKDRYPSANWPVMALGICIIGFLVFLVLDRKARQEEGASDLAFEVASGYVWILTTLIFSLLGMEGEEILNSICKQEACFSLAATIGSFKSYSLYLLFEVVVMATIVVALRIRRNKQIAESKKSASIHIAKPKKR